MRSEPGREFISEPITPESGSADSRAMAKGLAGLPTAFGWRTRRDIFGRGPSIVHRTQANRPTQGETLLRLPAFHARDACGLMRRADHYSGFAYHVA